MSAEEDVRLRAGHKVDGRWQVRRKLGQGAFGAVYEAVDVHTKVKGVKALKLESVAARDQVLKIEVAVLRALQPTNHVCRLYACGRNDKFNFMVMSLLGPSLAFLRKKQPEQKFTTSTSVNVTLQCLKSLNDMHNFGWLHRDVKPSNYAMGPPNDQELKRTVFILDFGLARCFVNPNGKIRAARELVGFRGTLRYCSVNGHRGKELGRQDDLLGLLYMFHEMIRGSLPWKTLNTNHEVLTCKLESIDELYDELPPKCLALHEYLHSIKYDDKPRYNMFEETLVGLVKNAKSLVHTPMDWEGGRKQVKPTEDDLASDLNLPRFGDDDDKEHENERVSDLPQSHYRELIRKKAQKKNEDDEDDENEDDS